MTSGSVSVAGYDINSNLRDVSASIRACALVNFVFVCFLAQHL